MPASAPPTSGMMWKACAPMRHRLVLLFATSLATPALAQQTEIPTASAPAARAPAVTNSIRAPAVTTLDAVTTSATRTPEVAGDAAASVSVIDREEIVRRQARTPVELLQDIPGVEISGVPRTTAMQPLIRGLGDERIVLRLDGARNNFNAGHRGRTFVDPELLRQVDVLRGPSSTLYGSGAIGGVISMRTIDPEDIIQPGNPVGGFLGMGWQSQGSGMRGFGAFAARAGDFGALAAATGFSNGQFRDGADRIIPFTADNATSVMGKVNWSPGHHRISLSAMQFEDRGQMPIAANTPTLQSITDRTTLQQSFTGRYTYANPNMPLIAPTVVLYHNRIDLHEQRLTGTRALDTTRLNTTGVDAQNTSRFSLFGADRHVFTVGMEYYTDTQEGGSNGLVRPQYPNAERKVLGFFAQDQLFLGPFTLTPGLRYDSIDQSRNTGIGGSQNSSRLSPQVSLAWQATPWLQPYISYTEAYRAPSLTELFVGGQHFPGNNFVPNPNLKPETAHNFEIGTNLRFSDVLMNGDRLRARVAMFRNNITDFIEQTVRATTTTSANIGEARIQGVEVEMQYDAGSWFAGIGGSLLRGDNLETNQPLASIPAGRLALNGGYRFQAQGLVVGGRLILNEAQTRIPNTGGYRDTASSAIMDIYASWTPPELQHVRFDLGANNLFDSLYRRPNWNAVPTPPFAEVGRNIRASMRVMF